MNIPKDGKEVPKRKETFLEKETFRPDPQLKEKLNTIPKGEKSFIIRMVLRDYFGLTDSKNGVVGYKEGAGKEWKRH
ncbi:hypothetical protein [Desulfosporosinus sp.]|uniref:hypothetical protein n=1 Tax=Desulfosporosinus sp. TaxID=157907 RepID=UPI0025C6B016|nr:hypothetical protein [Desulfosporosinus sp.]MBC2723330.1 hypothetical protein [Desulfosporosinus sp.]MBC2726232.1 hypothetical protein [Desulfosporosinus sp.]